MANTAGSVTSAALKQLTQALALRNGIQAVTLDSTLALSTSYGNILMVDPGGADRDVTLDVAASYKGLFRLIENTADNDEKLTVKNASGTTIGVVVPGSFLIFANDGTSWYAVGEETGVRRTGVASLTYSDTSPKTLFTVPAGQIWLVEAVILRITDGFDGTSPGLDIGISGGDTDGYIDSSAVSGVPDTAAIYAADGASRGALLHDQTDDHDIYDIIDATGGAKNVIATITPGSGATAGAATVHLLYTRLV